jgi:hypothetical protein
MSTSKDHAGAGRGAGHAGTGERWSQHVTEHSDALDLDDGVFTRDDPKSIARSLMRSAERSRRRKSEPYRSAMSMLTFYINRAGSNLSKEREAVLEKAKDELRHLHAAKDADDGEDRKGKPRDGRGKSGHG